MKSGVSEWAFDRKIQKLFEKVKTFKNLLTVRRMTRT